MSLATPESVQRLQAALHAKAKGEPNYRFYMLYDKVHRPDVLAHAYACCRANRGAAGVDGQTFEAIEAYGVERWLGELAEDLRKKTYRPEAVRRVWIPKPDGTKRPLGIPTIRDRVAQTAAELVLAPIFEADLPSEQYAYRPGRGALDAVQHVHRLLVEGYTEVVDADLSGYFDSIPHAELLKSVARRVVDGAMLHLIKLWLTMPVEEEDDRGRKQRTTRAKDAGRGTPQGAPISPLLANIYIRRFVAGWKALGHEARLEARIVNYADDFVICCRGTGAEALAAMRRMMARLKLTVNEAKTRVCPRAGRAVRLPGVHLRAELVAQDGAGVHRDAAVEEAARAAGDGPAVLDGANKFPADGRGEGGGTQPVADGLGELLLSGIGQPRVPGDGRAGPTAAASVAAR